MSYSEFQGAESDIVLSRVEKGRIHNLDIENEHPINFSDLISNFCAQFVYVYYNPMKCHHDLVLWESLFMFVIT